MQVEKIDIAYGLTPVVQEASFEVNRGEVVSIVGANGAGKSTLLKAIAGALKPLRGTVRFDGQDITGLASPDVVRLGINYVPEARRLFAPLSVEENLEIGAYILGDDRARVRKNFDFVYNLFPRLEERRDQPAGTMSGDSAT